MTKIVSSKTLTRTLGLLVAVSAAVLPVTTALADSGPSRAEAAQVVVGNTFENPENPWDHMGRLHNEGLDHVVESLQVLGPEPDRAKVVVVAIGSALQFTEERLGAVETAGLPFESLARVVASEEVDYAHLNAEQKEYMGMFFNLIYHRSMGTEEKIQGIKELESRIMRTFDAKEATPLLVGTSVGRHSIAYWSAQDPETTLWNIYPNSFPYSSTARWFWGTVGADAGGAMMFATGGPYGMLAGAVMGSAGHLLDYFLD